MRHNFMCDAPVLCTCTPEQETPDPLYKNRMPQAFCRNCGKTIVRDRWTTRGWGHYHTGDEFCGPPQTRAEPA